MLCCRRHICKLTGRSHLPNPLVHAAFHRSTGLFANFPKQSTLVHRGPTGNPQFCPQKRRWAFRQSLLGGGTIGAIVTAALTVSHERAERFRDRQFEAAGRFIADYEATLEAVVELWEAVTTLGDAKDQVHDAQGPAREAGREEVGGEVLVELAKALRVGVDLVGRDVSSRWATAEIARSRAVVEQAIENLAGRMEEPFASANRELLRAVQEASAALARHQEAGRQSRVTLHRLLLRVAQLNLLFAGKDAEVVEAARQATESLVLLAGRVLQIGMESEEFEHEGDESEKEEEAISDTISDEIQDANQLLAEFAALANDRVRPRSIVREWA